MPDYEDGSPHEQADRARRQARERAAWQALAQAEYRAWNPNVDGVQPLDLRLKFESAQGGGTFIVFRATLGDGTPVVAFHSGDDVFSALAGFWTKWQQGTLKWKTDTYRGG